MKSKSKRGSWLRTTSLVTFALLLVGGMLVSLGSAVEAQEDEGEAAVENAGLLAARGRVTFRIYCENCHGVEGKGNGAIADWLTVPPSDLTVVSAQNDGEFPAERLLAVIDGRKSTAGHVRKGSRDMPIWGEIFRDPMSLSPSNENEAPEDRAERKVKELVAFVRTLQPVE